MFLIEFINFAINLLLVCDKNKFYAMFFEKIDNFFTLVQMPLYLLLYIEVV